jgi:hypothetical protein
MATHKYVHRFKHGITATMTLTDDPPGMTVEWNGGKPTRAILEEYFGWRDLVLKEHAERTGKKILVVTV